MVRRITLIKITFMIGKDGSGVFEVIHNSEGSGFSLPVAVLWIKYCGIEIQA